MTNQTLTTLTQQTIIQNQCSPGFKPTNPKLNMWLIFSLGLLTAVIYPIFSYEYLFHDDWSHFLGKEAPCSAYPMASWFTLLGRPLGHEILCLQFKLLDHIGDGYIARGTTFSGLAILLVAIYLFLRRECFPSHLASFIAFGVTTLPWALVCVYWLGAGYIVFSLIASVFSALLCQQVLGQEIRGKKFYILILTAVLMEIASALIYQTGAMFFLVLAAVVMARTLKVNDRLVYWSTLLYGGIFAISNLIYFAGFKYFVANELAKVSPERGTLFPDFSGSFSWFTHSVLPRALRLWYVDSSTSWLPINWLPIVVGLTFIGSLAFYVSSIIYNNFSRRSSLLAIAYVMAILLLGISCFLPMLISSMRLEIFRSLVSLSSFIFSMSCIHLWLAFSKKTHESKITTYLITLTMISIAFLSHSALLTKMVMPKFVEVQYLKNIMKSAAASGWSSSPVHIIVPRAKESWNTDEIGAITTSFHQDVGLIIWHIRAELKLPLVKVTSSMYGEDFERNGKIIVDFSVIPNVGLADSLETNFNLDVWSSHGEKNSYTDRASINVQPTLLEEGYRGFNIIGYQNRIYAILQSEGAFSIDKINNNSYSRSIVGTSVEEVKQAIDRYEGNSYYPQPVILVEGYRGLNIIGAQNRVYAVPLGEGTLNILIAGTSIKEVMQQIDNASVKK